MTTIPIIDKLIGLAVPKTPSVLIYAQNLTFGSQPSRRSSLRKFRIQHPPTFPAHAGDRGVTDSLLLLFKSFTLTFVLLQHVTVLQSKPLVPRMAILPV